MTRHDAALASTTAINQLKTLIVSASGELSAEPRKSRRRVQAVYRAHFRERPAQDPENEILALVRQ
ncbi:hypothetical protein [Streptomyces sp. bgisy060]|uniref:hypothetical protein n=1 Tax=Streptomyces sp. bgisy060 TaxID=3413775 RepID=UPI003EBD5037